jgi:phosphoenolpyruvate carboxykinase (ATP)
LLGEKVQEHNADVWLVNTGWTGGPYGVGHRMALQYTRAMIQAILEGSLSQIETCQEPCFGLHIPVRCPNVPGDVLEPRRTWADPSAYYTKARELAALFVKNFEKYANEVDPAIVAAGPPQR